MGAAVTVQPESAATNANNVKRFQIVFMQAS
jgi:hypothetical protein